MKTICDVCGRSRASKKVSHRKCSAIRAERGFNWLHDIAPEIKK